MTSSRRRDIVVCVSTIEPLPVGMWPAAVQVGVEQASSGNGWKELLCFSPVSLENDAFMQLGYKRVFQPKSRPGKDSLVRRKQATLAEVLENMSKDGCLAILGQR
jgi:hypothetical protein